MSRAFITLIGLFVLLTVPKYLFRGLAANTVHLQLNSATSQLEDATGLSRWRSLLEADDVDHISKSTMKPNGLTRSLLSLGTRIDKNYYGWSYLEGMVLLANWEIDKARTEFTEAQSRSSRNAALAQFYIGLTYELQGKRSLAVKMWREGRETPRFFASIGYDLLMSGSELESATRYLATAVSIEPSSCSAVYFLGSTWMQRGYAQNALDVWSGLSNGVCHNSEYLGDMYFLRGRVLASLGRTEEAIDSIRRSLEEDPREVNRIIALADLLVEDGDFSEEARLLYLDALRIDPEVIWAYTGLCIVERLQHHLDEAYRWCEESVERFPTSAFSHFQLGWTYLDMEMFDEAVAQLEVALDYEPQNPFIWLRLGQAYRQLGDRQSALGAYEKALQLDPQNEFARRRAEELRE